MRKKRIITSFSFLCLLILYIVRVAYVNKDNAKCEITYLDDSNSWEYNGIQCSIEDETIYEMPAFVESYPEITDYYSYLTSMYTQGGNKNALRNLKYVISVKLTVKNISSKERQVCMSDYQIFGKAYDNGISPLMFVDLNGYSTEFELSPGKEKTAILAFNTHAETIRNLSYEKLTKEGLSLLISGYPHIQHVRLKQFKLVKSKGEFDPYKDEDMHSSVEDTKIGTVLGLGEELIQGGIGISTKSVDIVENIKDYPEFKKKFYYQWFEEGIEKDGSIKSYDEVFLEEGKSLLPKACIKYGYKTYMIFVKLNLHNYNSAPYIANTTFRLYDYKRKLSGNQMLYFAYDYEIQSEEMANNGKVDVGGDSEIICGYIVSIPRNIDLDDLDLYITNDSVVPREKVNLRKEESSGQTYLRVR